MEEMISKWSSCCACAIGKRARKHVFERGSRDSKAIFVGEGPGRSEDVVGQPFIGRSGQLLNRAIGDAGWDPRKLYFCNLVLCRPSDALGGPNRSPSEEEIERCALHLLQTFHFIKPKVVVWLGRTPQEFAEAHVEARLGWINYFLPHPSHILRTGGLQSPRYRGYVLEIREALRYA